MTTHPDTWHAYLADDNRQIITDPDQIAAFLTNPDASGAISIRRRTAHPDTDGRLPATCDQLDLFGVVELEDIAIDDAAQVWQLTLAAAQGLNQAAQTGAPA